MPRVFTSLRTRLLLLVLIATLPAVALILYSGGEQRRQAARAAEESTLRLVRLAASAQDSQIIAARQLLTTLGSIPILSFENTRACSDLLVNLQKKVPNYTALSLINPQGEIVCNSLALPAENVANEPYFKKVIATRDFTVGDYTLGPTSHKPVLPFLYPILDNSNQLQGVLLATLDLAWLSNLGSTIGLPPSSALLVVNGQGVVLARYPENEKYSGVPLPNAAIVQTVSSHAGEGTAEVAGVDGTVRLYGYTLLPGAQEAGAYIAIGIPMDVAYADVNLVTTRNLIGMVFVILVGLGVAWLFSDIFFLTQLRELLAAAHRMDAGDLSTQTKILASSGELSDLAVSFNQMAKSLQQRSQELQEYNVKLERSNRELQEFAYIASHDLQEPLRKIQAFGERLQTKYSDTLGEDGQDYLLRMVKAAARLQNLIDDLLSYSRVSTRARPFVNLNLTDCAREALSDLEERLAETGGEVLISPLPSIVGDPDQIRLLFQNLIANALKFHQPEKAPVVKVYAKADGVAGRAAADPVKIYVEDNGIGFNEKYLNRIFQPFQRLHARDVYQGSGIGLAICRKIVQRHNGEITATSQPGQGATFMVTLPRFQDNPQHSMSSRSTE